MKAIFLIILCVVGINLHAQSLKDALYGGRLKNDSGTVLKKGDTLKIRENMALKAKQDTMKKETAEANVKIDSLVITDTINKTDPSTVQTKDTTVAASIVPVTVTLDPVKENNRIWKAFVDEYVPIIQAEALPSKKIKSGTYSVLIEYEIGLDGYVTTQNIYCSPQNSYLVEQVKLRMMNNAPQLNPVLLSNGKPRKALRKQTLTFVKEKN